MQIPRIVHALFTVLLQPVKLATGKAYRGVPDAVTRQEHINGYSENRVRQRSFLQRAMLHQWQETANAPRSSILCLV